MTLIHFTYSAGYHRPATGGVVFMPHRKHASNETVVLPKPFTRPLVGGVVEVDLEPTGDDWLWSVTHDHDTRFYAIPDIDGVINHTELIPVAPSTLTHRIEPVWWAELRQHQQFIADYVNESRSNVCEAIDTVNGVHGTLETAVNDAQRHESVAGAYSRQAQTSSEQAWEAVKAPGGFAEQAKADADRAEIYRNESNTHRIDSQTARDETFTARGETVTARDEAVTARDEAVTARDEATDMVENEIRGPEGPIGPEGPQGPQGPTGTIELIGDNPTITVDTAVGTRVFVGDTMIYGDTGIREITQLLPEITSGNLYVLRTNDTVKYIFRNVVFNADSSVISQGTGFLPNGFRGAVTLGYQYEPLRGRSNEASLTMRITSTGGVDIYNVDDRTVQGTATFLSQQDWPTTLPGTLA